MNHNPQIIAAPPNGVTQNTSSPAAGGRLLLAQAIIVFADLCSLSVAALLALQLRANLLPAISGNLFAAKLIEDTFLLLWWYPLAFIFSYAYEKLYTRRMPFWLEVEVLIRANTLALAIILVPLGRYLVKKLLVRFNLWTCPLILIGTAETALLVQGALQREATTGYHLLGYISPTEPDGSPGCTTVSVSTLPCLGPLEQGETLVAQSRASDLVIALPGLSSDLLVELTTRFQPLVNNILIVPDLFGISLNGIEVTYFFEEQALFLHIRNRLKSTLSRFIKRLFDLFCGAALFIIAGPVLLITALLVVCDSPGPVFFTQQRLGQGGRLFMAYKFRTMFVNCDQILTEHLSANREACQEWEKYKKLKNSDPRVTRVGRLLRRYSIDELPQIINVLRGEMSLVGLRPYLPREIDDMGPWARDILITKPGLTGLWQVSGRNNLSFKSRLRLDAWYVRNWSMWLDITMILKTFRVVYKGEGAY